MRRVLAVAAAAILLLLVAEAAVAAAPAAAPSALAQDLARVLVPKETWTLGTQQLGAVVRRNLEGHPGSKLQYPADLPERIRTEVEAALPYDELVNMHAKVLSATYGEPELKELIAFFRGPTGQKYLQVQTNAGDAVTLETQRRFEKKLPEIMKKLGALAQAGEPAKHGAQAKSPHGEQAKIPHGAPAKDAAK